MNKHLRVVFQMLVLMAALSLAATASAQSLGDAARRVRAQKRKQPKATRVYTTDNMPRASRSSTAAVATEAKATPGEKPKEGKPAESAEGKKSRAELEKEYREKAGKLREALALEERKLEVLQRELNMANVQFYSDPNAALREQTARAEITARQQELEQQKGAIAASRKAIADLEEELRRKGLPPGWAR